MKAIKLCATLSRYARTVDGNIKHILREIFAKYNITNFDSISRYESDSRVILSTEDGRKVFLNINENRVYLINKFDYLVEEYMITSAGEVYETVYEQRPKGLIVSEIKKEYHSLSDKKENLTNTAFSVNRYCFTNKTINELIPDFASSSYSPTKLDKFRDIYHKMVRFNVESLSDYRTYYNSYIFTKYINLYSEEESNDYLPNRINIYINGEDQSSLYDMINKNDKLDIAYELFMGKVSDYVMDEILNINLGIIDKDSFDLYSKLGYKDEEDYLVGGSLIKKTREFKFNTKKVILENFNIGHFTSMNTREELLNIFRYKPLTNKGIMRTLK